MTTHSNQDLSKAAQPETPHQEVGRNEPCPCGSKKKYKRCHGFDAPPKLSPASASPTTENQNRSHPSMFPQFDPSQLDPQWMMKFSQAMQRLPKAHLQRLQSIMQKAMAGKDVTQDAMELEKILPPDFQELLRTFKMPPGMMDSFGGANPMSGPMPGMMPGAMPTPAAPMEVDEARRIVEEAVASGKLSKEEAEKLLSASAKAVGSSPADSVEDSSGKASFWKRFTGKK